MKIVDYLGKKYLSCWDFALSYHGGVALDAFEEVDDPQDGDVFMLYRQGSAWHCGIICAEGYLHQLSPPLGVIYTTQGFDNDIRYFRLRRRTP